jgi:hypothetical protein
MIKISLDPGDDALESRPAGMIYVAVTVGMI